MTIVWVLWLWFIPFGATMGTPFYTLPVPPSYETREACEAEAVGARERVSSLWPDEQANTERIDVRCIQKQVVIP